MIFDFNNSGKQSGMKTHLPALLLFLLLSLILLGPVLLKPGLYICSDDAPDAWIHIWTFWRSWYAMLGFDHSYFLSHSLTYPGLVHVPIAVFDPLLPLMSVPLFALFGSFSVVYNLLVFFGLIFSGMCGYALGVVFSNRRSSGLIAGVIIAANPFTYRLIAGGYIEYAWWGLLPLTVALYYSCIKKPSKLNIAGYVISLSALLLMLIYCASYFVLISCVSLLFAIVSFLNGRRTYLLRLIKVQSIAVCCLLPLLLFWVHCLGQMEWKNVGWPHRFPVEKVSRYSKCDLSYMPGTDTNSASNPGKMNTDNDIDFKSPEELAEEWMAWRVLIGSLDLAELVNPIRSWSKKYPSGNIHPADYQLKQSKEPVFFFDESVFLAECILALLLCVFAFKDRSKRKENAIYAGCGLMFLVLAIGPYLIWNGSVVGFVKLPYLWMYEWIPGFCRFFIPGRAFLGVVVFGSILAVRGLEALTNRFRSRIRVILNVVTAILLFLTFALFGYGKLTLPRTDVQVPEIFSEIADQSGEFAIINLPVEGNLTRRMLFQSIHNRPIYGGEVANEWTSPDGTEIVDTNALVLALQHQMPANGDKNMLQFAANSLYELGFHYIIIYRDGYIEESEYNLSISILDDLLGIPFYKDHEISIYLLTPENAD